ncbi:hypothetical protein H8S23_05175 [Anaerofilum sp. BX8]|uniref:Uncharacterized protein n=1 Tax=Anaerofilum hominis TaxID=2763016 RepID=A0A923I856_9FIRM|nr:hypothetical protein [Anaerofilum hominis]MBC5580889.1 hypothetical protein [Anaerofilum hominis]
MDKEMIVTELRCFDFRADCKSCHYHEAGAPYPYRLYWDAADLIKEQAAEIERQAAEIERLTAERDAAQRALRLSIETYSVDTMQTERLERYYIKRAYRLLGAEEGENHE